MATKRSTKAAVLEDETTEAEVEVEATEPTTKQIVNEGIARVIEATGIDVQKNRYKAMRAIAFQAFTEAIESGDFDALVDRAIANVDELPAGWEIERGEAAAKPAPKAKTAPAAKAPAKKAPAKAAAAKAATPRRRPAR
jgi:hypothetical protein